MRATITLTLTSVALLLLGTGCATKKYVRGEVGDTEARMGERVSSVEDQVESNQVRLDEHGETLEEHEAEIGQVSQTAREALERAMEAGKLAKGKLLYETTLTDEHVRFGFEEASLRDEASAALDDFARQLKERNASVYIEIQGHTDSSGPEEYNLKLGEERAEAVRRYLNLNHDIPLHRMSVISYGESAPAADNSTREGRQANRRVVLVVLE